MSTSTKTDEFYQNYLNGKAEPWTPTDQKIDPLREEALKEKMDKFINKLESSQFYREFRDEVQNSPIGKHIQRILGSESKMKMVIYGIGSIEFGHCGPPFQLSLAILMKKDFNWIGDVEVFDPVLSKTEIRVLESFGFSVLSFNEQARRQVMKPTMFFMPHCHLKLYNNLIQANWRPNQLNNIVIFGNSFGFYYDRVHPRQEIGHMRAAQPFTNELKMSMIGYDAYGFGQDEGYRPSEHEVSFDILSWHFFNPTWLQFMREETRMKLMREKMRMQVMRENISAEYRQLKGKLGEIFPHKKEALATSKPSQKEECLHTHQKVGMPTHASSHYNYIPMAVVLVAPAVCLFTKLKCPNPFRNSWAKKSRTKR